MVLSKSKIFLILCSGFIIGVWLGKYVNQEVMAVCAMFFVIVATLGWQTRAAKVIGFAGLIMVLGMTRIYFALEENRLQQFYGQTAQITGVIVEEPDIRSDKTYLTVGRLRIDGEPVNSKLLASVGRFPEYKYGDQIEIEAEVQEPRDAETDGSFSYKNYLSKSGIEAIVYYPKIEKMGSGGGNAIKSGLISFKQMFIRGISEILPEPHNSFLAGLLVGLRRGIPGDLLESFSITGTTHIIALSGFNITIIAQFIDLIFLKWFSRRISFILALFCIGMFVIMTGASASVVRAAVMGALGMLALNIGRVTVIANALVLTGAVMVGINPKILHFDVGFQLSFLALTGLVYFAPMIEPYFNWMGKFIRQILTATLSAQVFVIPVLLLNFDRLSLVAPLTNLLILPFIPLAMLFGFLTGAVAMIWQALAYPFAWITWIVLQYIISMTQLTAKIPFASVQLESFGIIFLLAYYLILTIFLFKYYNPNLWESLSIWKLKLKTS